MDNQTGKKEKLQYIRGKYSEGQNLATQRYVKANYDQITLRVHKGEKAEFAEFAQAQGLSLNMFIYQAMCYYKTVLEDNNKPE